MGMVILVFIELCISEVSSLHITREEIGFYVVIQNMLKLYLFSTCMLLYRNTFLGSLHSWDSGGATVMRFVPATLYPHHKLLQILIKLHQNPEKWGCIRLESTDEDCQLVQGKWPDSECKKSKRSDHRCQNKTSNKSVCHHQEPTNHSNGLLQVFQHTHQQ